MHVSATINTHGVEAQHNQAAHLVHGVGVVQQPIVGE